MLEILSMQVPLPGRFGIGAPAKCGYSDEARGLDRLIALRTLYETACIFRSSGGSDGERATPRLACNLDPVAASPWL